MPSTTGSFRRWRILAALSAVVLVNAGFSPIVGGALVPAMQTDLLLDRSSIGLSFAVFMLMAGLWGPAVAWAIGRFGAVPVMVTGSGMICAGALAMGLAVTTGWQMVAAHGLLIGGGAGVGGLLVTQTVATRWFEERPAFAVSVVMIGAAIGSMLGPPLVAALSAATDIGWRAGWLLLAALSVGGALIALLVVQDAPPAGGSLAGHGQEAGVSSSGLDKEWTLRAVLATRPIWAVLGAAAGAGATVVFVLAHGVSHLADQGIPVAKAVLWLTLMSAGQLAGTLCTGLLAGRIAPNRLLGVNLFLLAAGLLMLRSPGGVPLTFINGVIVGFGFGGSLTGIMSMPADYYGRAIYPVLIGLITPVLTIAGAIASYGGGFYFDRMGNYDPVFFLVTTVLAGTALCQFFIGRPRT